MERKVHKKRHISKNLPWTEAEDRRLIALISENSGNLNEAFKQYSEAFPVRTFGACVARWYQVLKKRNNVCLMTLDKKHRHINGKNIRTTDTSNKTKVSLWKQVLKIFGL